MIYPHQGLIILNDNITGHPPANFHSIWNNGLVGIWRHPQYLEAWFSSDDHDISPGQLNLLEWWYHPASLFRFLFDFGLWPGGNRLEWSKISRDIIIERYSWWSTPSQKAVQRFCFFPASGSWISLSFSVRRAPNGCRTYCSCWNCHYRSR